MEKHIVCYLVVDGKFEAVALPENFIVPLSNMLRKERTVNIQLANRSIEAEGLFIPGKGMDSKMLLIFNADDKN